MKSFVIALAVALVAATSVPGDAYARRIGGGGAAGMQRSMPPRATPDAPCRPSPPPPAAQARPPPQPPARRRGRAKRSWLGPIAGLAAGLGIAALMSHLGLGAAFGNILMMHPAGGRRLLRDPLPAAPLRPESGGGTAAAARGQPAVREAPVSSR